MADLVATFTLIALLFAICFLLLGHSIVSNMSVIKKLRKSKLALSSVSLFRPISRGTTFSVLTKRLLNDVIDTATQGGVAAEFGHRNLGDICEIVHYREGNIKKIVHELRTYSFLLSMLSVVGIVKVMGDSGFEGGLTALWNTTGSHPLQILALFELVMLIFFLFRLFAELKSISDLLED